jgi:hypothetical protein
LLPQAGIAVSLGFDNGSSANGYALGIASGGLPANSLEAIFGSVWYFGSGFTFASTSQWHQVVMLRRLGVTSFYVDGVATPGSTSATPLVPTSFRIGAQNGVRFFNGAIDEVRVYNRALSTNEVTQLYSIEMGVCTPHAALATAQVINGFVVGANIIDYGCGYTTAPEVLVVGSGSGATASATVQDGYVTSINIINTGSGYSNLTEIIIGSPPFVPTVSINVSRINVTQHVVLGLKYVLESSSDLVNWTATGPAFTAQSESITTEFVVVETGQYFRIRQVP